jgi:Helix-turn-helix of DDE superfamily endonuclease/DDE superfamily endonuclease
MLTYAEVRGNRRRCLALTGLTPSEFDLLLPAFSHCCERLYPADRTLAGRPRQRFPGGGRTGVLHAPEQKLLFLLVYLKTYPLQVVLAELFSLRQPQVNYWLRRLLPVLRDALDELGVLPERDPQAFARPATPPLERTRRIIDGTERRRQRPKSPEKQRAHYSGRKKAHSDKNVVVADADSKRIGYLSWTYAGRVPDKSIADREGIDYPPGTVLYKDGGFQGYEPAVARTCQAKKKAAGRGANGG